MVSKGKGKAPAKAKKIKPIPFGERPGSEPYNASEVVALADSRFLFCDNNIGDALFELRLAKDGSMACPLVRRPIEGLGPGAIDDLEGLELVEAAGRQYIFATSSFSLKRRKGHHQKKERRGLATPARESLMRIEIGEQGQLRAEIIANFRRWLVAQAPELRESADYLPDDGGLNVEALGWDRVGRALLFGLRTPVADNGPLLIRVRLKHLEGPWGLDNLEVIPSLSLAIKSRRGEEGIRAMSRDRRTGITLFTVGNAVSSSKTSFKLYSWDGNAEGRVRRFKDVRFDRGFKVEGVTHGTIGGRGAVVFVDDGGGYQFLWDEDPRLASALLV